MSCEHEFTITENIGHDCSFRLQQATCTKCWCGKHRKSVDVKRGTLPSLKMNKWKWNDEENEWSDNAKEIFLRLTSGRKKYTDDKLNEMDKKK
jgi:hypothetical protein